MAGDFEIVDAKVRKILDSRGNPTVEAEIYLPFSMGRTSAPSGASTGATEVASFPKNGPDDSIKFFNSKVRSAIVGFNAMDQRTFDKLLAELDGSGNFSNMGGNLSTALSLANAKAVAGSLGIPLYGYVGGAMKFRFPHPIGNVLGGGKHSMNGTTIQEFLVSSQGKTIYESIYTNSLVHKRIGKLLEEKLPNQSIGVGDERAWTANISDEEAIDIVKKASKEISQEKKIEIKMGADFAASSFYKDGKYHYKSRSLDQGEQVDYAVKLSKEHGFYFIEDPMDEADFDGFAMITKEVGNRSLIVGDDLYTTNPERIKKGIEKKSTNAVLIKVNQIGTLSRTQDAVDMATSAGWKNVISHRSGETDDDFIAHLSIAFGSELIKTGTIGGERLAKLNELVRIQEDFQS